MQVSGAHMNVHDTWARFIQYVKSMVISQVWYKWPLCSHAQIVTPNWFIGYTYSFTFYCNSLSWSVFSEMQLFKVHSTDELLELAFQTGMQWTFRNISFYTFMTLVQTFGKISSFKALCISGMWVHLKNMLCMYHLKFFLQREPVHNASHIIVTITELCEVEVITLTNLYLKALILWHNYTFGNLLLKPMDSFGMWWKSNEIIFLYRVLII